MAHGRSGKQKADTVSKRAIFVLGMHRSGTSALAGVLAALGVTMPQTLMTAHPTNPKGFFESYAIMNLSDEMLRAAGRAWDDWRTIDIESLSSDEYRAKISDVFSHEFSGDPALIAIKDPRHCRMAPVWLSAFEDFGYKPLIILPYRHPLEVAQSLASRDDMPVAQALLIWLRHVLDAEVFTRGRPRAFVYMPDLLANWRTSMDQIAAHLNIEWPLSSGEKAEQIDHFLDQDLKNHTIPDEMLDADPMTRGWVARTFHALQALAANPDLSDSLAALDAIRSEFDLASALFGEALSGLETRNRTLEHKQIGIAAENLQIRADMERLRLERDNRTVENRILVDRLATETAQTETLREKARLTDGLTHEAEVLRARVAALDNDVFHLHAGLVAAEAHRKELDAERRELRDQLEAASEKISILEQNFAIQAVDLATRTSDLTHVVQVRNQLAANLEKAVRAHDELARVMTQQLEAARADLQAVESQLRAYRDAGPMRHISWALGQHRP